MSSTTPLPSPSASAVGPPRPPPGAPTQQQLNTFTYFILTSLVLVSWELLVHGFQDLAYLKTKGWWRRPVLWAYFLQRYGAFAVLVSQANIRLGIPPSCTAAGYVSLTVGGVIVMPAISLVYLYRVLAIWQKNTVVKYTLMGMWVIVWGASCTAPFAQRADKTPTGACTITRSEKYTPAGFIANAVYDATVFILTVWKLIANRKQYKGFKSPIQTILLRDGVLYFGVSVIIGITDIVFLEAVKSPVVASTIIPLHIALASVMTTRLVNNVFQIVSDGQSSLPRGTGTSKASASVGVWNKNSTAAQSATIVIGSGVGTDYFDVADKTTHPGDMETGFSVDEVKHSGNNGSTYNVPMQVRVTKDQPLRG